MKIKDAALLVTLGLLTGCSLLSLPFQLLGMVFKGVMGLFNAILGLGSAAAVQAAKLAPYALFFTQSEMPSQNSTLEPEQFACSMESIQVALESAPLEIQPLSAVLNSSSSKTEEALLLDPVDLLIPERAHEFCQKLNGRSIVSAHWVRTE